ncbi:MAG: zinc ribbon domain-containing protein [Bacteroidetes bacterium]|nr:zinc ribbon domain-containing protein [Bacteroidota bacterium]
MMLIIFGVGHKTYNNRSFRDATYCFHCHNTSRWLLSKITTWFSLFFIPVIPVKTAYGELCPICKQGKKLSRVEYESKVNQTD